MWGARTTSNRLTFALYIRNGIKDIEIILSARFLIFLILGLILGSDLSAQVDRKPTFDKTPTSYEDVQQITPVDTTRMDSLAQQQFLSQISISKDAIDQEITYTADSSEFLVKEDKVFLYKNAVVNYGQISLKADYIEYNIGDNTVFARGVEDTTTHRVTGNPVFKDGPQQFTARSIRYNFRSGKAIVYDVRTQQDQVYIQGVKTKYVSETGDTSITDYVYNENAIFTTCDHPTPHFGVRSIKQKKIGDKQIIVGPSNLEIAGVPTPLWIPFGFFPIPKDKQGGLIIPRDYEYSDQLGFGLRNIGYYFNLGEHMDLKLTSDIYLRGTFALYAQSSYRRRYKHNGSMFLSFSNRRIENLAGQFERDKSFSIRWSHNQDSKAHPYNQFSGSVNIQTNDFQRTNLNNANSVLQGTLSSNISFRRQFPNKPMSLTASMNHSQNTSTRRMTINFPNLNFQTQTFFPFKPKNKVGKEKWFEKLSFKYDADAQSQVIATDTTLFEPETLDNLKAGIRHRMSSGINFKVFKYFNLNLNASSSEIWNFNNTTKSLDRDSFVVQVDTITGANGEFLVMRDTSIYGEVITNNGFGFNRLNLFQAAASLNTQIFGTLDFKKGKWLKGLRHIVKPSISVGYTPDYTRESLGYFRTHDTDTRLDFNQEVTYSIFENSLYQRPSSAGRQLAASYSINNIFEAKVFSKKDSSDQVVKLFKNFVINGNYNFEADSLKWSPISMNGTTTFFNNMSNLNFGFMWDPYQVNDNGTRINTTYKEATGKPLRYMGGTMALSTRLRVDKIKALFKSKKERERLDEKEREEKEALADAREDASFGDQDNQFGDRGLTVGGDPFSPGQKTGEKTEQFRNWFDKFSIDHNIRFISRIVDGRVQNEVSTHTINVRGNIQITDNWTLTIGNFGYDFKNKGLSYPSFTFYRDLHCWEMGMNWFPQRGVYSFFLRVKPGPLGWINIPSSRNNVDGISGF